MQKTEYVNLDTHIELKPPKYKQREYFFLQNLSLDTIYYSEDTLATVENGIQVGAGQFIELDLRSGGVPRGHVWLSGNSASPARQRVLIKED